METMLCVTPLVNNFYWPGIDDLKMAISAHARAQQSARVLLQGCLDVCGLSNKV